MVEFTGTDFCTNCRNEREYKVLKEKEERVIKDKKYVFLITKVKCKFCGADMSIPGLIDLNIQEIDEQYRMIEGLAKKTDIEKLMDIYNIGKAPLSLGLGFGEVTIPRYLEGQIPSREYSHIIKYALVSPSFFKDKLEENKNKISNVAYKKAIDAIASLEKITSISPKMRMATSYIFKKMDEVTPLTLQKLLYFSQGINLALNSQELFPEDCEAWIHGPVYKKEYELFKDFKYNPIDDARFSLLEEAYIDLSMQEMRTIDIVINTFGMYSGKTLERITHKETPWLKARDNCGEDIPANVLIPKESIRKYFSKKNDEYGFDDEEGVNRYIQDMLLI